MTPRRGVARTARILTAGFNRRNHADRDRRLQLGGTLVTQANGFTPTSIALVVYGGTFLTTQIPLALVLPGALPGCELVPSPDITAALLPAAGVATAVVPLPSSAALVGAKLYHQFAQFDLDAFGNIQRIATSNALMLRLF